MTTPSRYEDPKKPNTIPLGPGLGCPDDHLDDIEDDAPSDYQRWSESDLQHRIHRF